VATNCQLQPPSQARDKKPHLQIDSPERMQRVQSTFASLPENAFPEMRRLAGELAAPTTDRHHTGLRWLLDGISHSAHDSPSTPS
jgi:hypothetical protein